MCALKNVRIKYMGREVECLAQFDTGSGATIVQRAFFEENFGASWLKLDKPLRFYWVNGRYIEADKYAQVVIVIDDLSLPETVIIVDDYVGEVEVEGRRIQLPKLIIGSGTMDKYGISLDPREGVKLTGATPLV